MNNKRITYTTARGYELELRAVSPFLINDAKNQFPDPPKPTYTTTTAAGTEEVHEHNYIKDESGVVRTSMTTPEEFEAWGAWEKAVAQTAIRRNKALALLLIREGVVNMPEPDDEWSARMKRYGVNISDDPDDRLVQFLQYELCGSLNDYMSLQLEIQKAGGDLSEEAITEIEHSFRRSVQELTTPKLVDTARSLDIQRAAGESAGSSGLGVDPNTILRVVGSGSSSDDRGESGQEQDDSIRAGKDPAQGTGQA